MPLPAGDRVVGLAALDDELFDRLVMPRAERPGRTCAPRCCVAGDADLVAVAGTRVGGGVGARAASASTRASPVGTALETIVSSPSSSAAVALSCVSAPLTRTTGFSPEMTAVAPSEPSVTLIGPSVPSDDHAVDREIGGAVERAEVDRDVAHVGAGEVADGHVVGAAERADAAASTLSTSSVMFAMLRNRSRAGRWPAS